MRIRARWTFWLTLAPLLVGAQPSRDQADDVLEATLRGVATEFLTAEVRATGAVACVQIDPGGAPQSVSREFLGRFKSLPFVRRGAECEAHPGGASEHATRAPAIMDLDGQPFGSVVREGLKQPSCSC